MTNEEIGKYFNTTLPQFEGSDRWTWPLNPEI